MARIIFMNNVNRFQPSVPIQKSNDNLEQIAKSIKKLYKESERRGFAYGDFSKVKVNFLNKNKSLDVKNIELAIKPSILLDERPKERALEILVQSALNEKDTYKIVLKRGDKEEILKFLQSNEAAVNINEFIQKASEKFNDI